MRIRRLLFYSFLVYGPNAFAQQLKLVLPIGHTAEINTIQFNPNGKQLITGSGDNTVKIWDVGTGNLLTELAGHAGEFSLDGKKIVTVDQNAAKIWDAATGKYLTECRPGNDDINLIHFSPDGKKIVLIFKDYAKNYSAEIWDVASTKRQVILSGHSKEINTVQFSPDGEKIVTASHDNTAKIWDAATGILLQELKNHSDEVFSAQFSSDGKKIVTASRDNTVKTWNVTTGKLIEVLKGHTMPVASAQFSPDDKEIVSSSWDSTARIWDVAKGKLLLVLKTNTNLLKSASFSPDGKRVLTFSKEGSAKIWDAVNGELLKEIYTHTEDIRSAQFSPDGKRIATASRDQTAKIWNATNGKLLVDLKTHVFSFTNIRFSPLGKKIVSAIGFSAVKIWDAATGNLLLNIKGDMGYVIDAQFSPDEKKILTIADSVAKIWDAVSGNLLVEIKGDAYRINSGHFSPDGKKMLTVSFGNTARVWEANTGSLLQELQEVSSAKFSPDGKKIIIISVEGATKIVEVASGNLLVNIINNFVYELSPDEKKIILHNRDATKILNAASGKVIATLDGGALPMNTFQFSPDGNKIVTTSDDNSPKLWDALTGSLLAVLKGHTDKILRAQFSPDGNKILSTSWDGTAKVWEVATGNLLEDLKGNDLSVFDAQFSPDGKKILTASTDGTARIWDAGKGNLSCTFFPVDSVDYFIQIPSGEYMSSRGASKLLHYVSNDLKVISFEQLDVKYNRPDKVLEAIGNSDTALIKSYRKAWEKRIKKLGIDTTAFREGYSIPEADFANRESIEYEQRDGTLQLHIQGKDSIYKLDRFNLWVNESPVFGQRGISLKKSDRNDLDTNITVTLSQGENRIETSVRNVNGTESYRMPLVVNYVSITTQKEVTHFIGIGIDKFADNKYNLQYSCKDIRDLSIKLKEKYGNDITIDTIFNENVSVNSVKSLKQKLLQTTENDKVIIAYSGHGLLSKDFDYYLSTYSVNFDKPEVNGLSYDELENLLDSIPARKKLMLIDACHSGEVDKEELVRINNTSDSLHLTKGVKPVAYEGDQAHLGMKNSFELMQNLFVNVGKSTGATIISAAAGTQFALERGDLQNGVFTYCILEAMDKNKTMKISELKKVVGERVEQLTNGLQKPTSRNETIAVDWSLW